jgi:hypothetical protein
MIKLMTKPGPVPPREVIAPKDVTRDVRRDYPSGELSPGRITAEYKSTPDRVVVNGNGSTYTMTADEFEEVRRADRNIKWEAVAESQARRVVARLLGESAIPPVEKLFATFKKVNADCAKSGESVVSFDDIEFYSLQICYIFLEGEETTPECDAAAEALRDYAKEQGYVPPKADR